MYVFSIGERSFTVKYISVDKRVVLLYAMHLLAFTRTRILVFLFAIGIPISLFVFLLDTLLFYWSLPYVIGWDGTGHATIAKVYAETIFPATWGWIDAWYTGMPFPQFYPPLFYFVFAYIYLLTSFEYLPLFKGIVITLTLGIPPLLMWLTYAHTKRTYPTLSAGVLSAMLILTDFQYTLGIDFISSLYTGLVTQLFAFYFFIFWFSALIKRKWVLSTVLLALLALSNAHMVPVALVFYTASCAFDLFTKRSLSVIYPYLVSGFLAIGITAFWSFPMLWYSEFLLTKSIPLPSLTTFIIQHALLFATCCIGCIVGIWKKDHTLFIPSTAAFALLSLNITLSLSSNTGLPLHLYRWLGPMLMLVPFILIYTIHTVIASKKFPYKNTIYVISAAIFLIFSPIAADTIIQSKGVTEIKEIPQLLSVAQTLKGRIVVEGTSYSGSQTSFVLEGLLGAQGNTGTISVFRESSINALFFIPVRNTVSSDRELWGFDSFLNNRETFFMQSPHKHVDRLITFNISHVIVRSKRVKDILEADPRVRLHAQVDKWHIYTITPTDSTVDDSIALLTQPPIPLFIPLGFSGRDSTQFTWARIQEEVLYANNNLRFLSPNDEKLDTSPTLDIFPVIVISSYQYHNRKRALERLADATATKTLYLIDDGSDDAQIFIEHLQFLPNVIVLKTKDTDMMHVVQSLFSSLEETIQNDAFSKTKVPYYLIRASYFPARSNGGTIYLGTPGFMISDTPIIPELTTPNIVYVGYIVSGLSVLTMHLFRKRIRSLSSSEPFSIDQGK